MERRTNGCLVLLCSILLTVLAQNIEVKELPQGLLQRPLNLKIKVKEWKVVITVEEMSTQWDGIMRVVKALSRRNISQMDPWSKNQMRILQHRVSRLSHSHPRRRRGLVDGVGKVTHALFGLATDEEVGDLRSKIEENRRFQQEMSSWSEDYVVVLNKTRADLDLNRAVINNITERTINFIDETHMVMTLQQQVHELELIDQRRKDILDDLDHGQLTELLLPRNVFSTFERVPGEHWLPADWYYRWCSIAPLWNKGWVFETRLPVVSQSPVLGFELEAFPVWGPGNHTVKLDISRYAALDTGSGIVSEPHSCTGKDPVVCSQGIIRPNGCATAVVVQRDITPTCNVVTMENPPRFIPLTDNEIVTLLQEPTDFVQRCPNSRQTDHVTIGRGSYRVQWTAGCRLEMKDFTISSVKMPVGHRKVEGWTVPEGAINLMTHFSRYNYPTALPPIIPLNLNLLPRPSNIQWANSIDSWTLTLGLIMSILAVLIALLFWKIYGPWQGCKCTRTLEAPEHEELVLSALPDPTHQVEVKVEEEQSSVPGYTFST